MKTKTNVAKIEGILSEIDLKETQYTKDGKVIDSIGGVVKILVETMMNGQNVTLEIPVHCFANKYTKNNAENPAYKSLMDVKTNFISIAASDKESADKVRCTGSIQMNEYYSQNETLVSFPRIQTAFINKIKKTDEFKPDAIFTTVFMIGQAGYETDKDGVETDRYKIVGMVPQYGDKVDIVPFYAVNKGVIDAVSTAWAEGDTVTATGKIMFTSTTETIKEEMDFGDAVERTRTVNKSDLIITGGQSTPLEGEFAIDAEEVKAGLAKRKATLDMLKEKASKKAAAPQKAAPNFLDLGF